MDQIGRVCCLSKHWPGRSVLPEPGAVLFLYCAFPFLPIQANALVADQEWYEEREVPQQQQHSSTPSVSFHYKRCTLVIMLLVLVIQSLKRKLYSIPLQVFLNMFEHSRMITEEGEFSYGGCSEPPPIYPLPPHAYEPSFAGFGSPQELCSD